MLSSLKSASGTLAKQLFDTHAEALFAHRVGLVSYQELLDYLTNTKGHPTGEELTKEVVYERRASPFTPYSLRDSNAPKVSTMEIHKSLPDSDIVDFMRATEIPLVDSNTDIISILEVIKRLQRYATAYQKGTLVFYDIFTSLCIVLVFCLCSFVDATKVH